MRLGVLSLQITAASCTCMSRLRLKLARAMLWFKCKQAVMRGVTRAATRPSRPQQRHSSSAGAARSSSSVSLRRRAAHQSKDLEEAVLQMWNKLANSEDHAHQLALCRSLWIVSSPARTQTSPTRTSTSSELGWATHITDERFLMPRPQLQPQQQPW